MKHTLETTNRKLYKTSGELKKNYNERKRKDKTRDGEAGEIK